MDSTDFPLDTVCENSSALRCFRALSLCLGQISISTNIPQVELPGIRILPKESRNWGASFGFQAVESEISMQPVLL